MDKLSITDNFNSLIESTTNLIQMASRRMQLLQCRSHATELQTVWKLVQNDLNPTPYAFTLGNNSNNSPMLSLVSPNSPLDGRITTRTSSGPLQLLTGPSQPMAEVEQLYSAWSDVYDALLPLSITAHQFCQGNPEPRTPENKALYYVVNEQQQPLDSIVSPETSLNQGGW